MLLFRKESEKSIGELSSESWPQVFYHERRVSIWDRWDLHHIGGNHVVSDELRARIFEEHPLLPPATTAPITLETGESWSSLTENRIQPTSRLTFNWNEAPAPPPFKFLRMTRPAIDPESTDPEYDALLGIIRGWQNTLDETGEVILQTKRHSKSLSWQAVYAACVILDCWRFSNKPT